MKSPKRAKVAATLGLALALAFALSWPSLASVIGPPIQTRDGADWWPAISYNPTSDKYLVVWGDYNDYGTGGPHAKAQIIDPDGSDLIGRDFFVSSYSAGGTYFQSVAYNSENGEWLVFFVVEPTSNQMDLYAQRIGSDGSQLGSYMPLTTTAAAESQAHAAYSTGTHRYLVTWTDWTSPLRIYGKLLDQNGAPIGSRFAISDGSAYSKWESRVAYNPVANEFLVVWADQRNWNGQGNDNDWVDSYAQRINASTGALIGGNVMVCGPTGTPYVGDGMDLPEIVCNPTDGKYFLAVTRLAPGLGWVSMGRVLNSNATPYTGLLNVSYPERGGFAGLVYNPVDNTYITSYLDANYDISAKQYSATGSQIGSVIPVFRTPLYEENFGTMAIRPSDGQLAQVSVWFENLVTHTRPSPLVVQRLKLGPDTTGPIGPVSLRAYKESQTSVRLTWTNPADSDLLGVTIRRKSGSYPTSYTDGSLVTNRSASPGAGDSATNTIASGETWHYALFAYDNASPTHNYTAAGSAISSDCWLNETFDNYALGYLDMQGGWIRSDNGTRGCYVQDQVRTGSSGKAVEVMWGPTYADQANMVDFGVISGGRQKVSFDMRRNATVDTNQSIIEFYGAGSKLTRVYWGENYNVLTGPGDTLTALVSSPASGQWYHVELVFDLDLHTLDAWVDSVRKVTAAPFWQTTSQIDTVGLTGYNVATIPSYLDNLKGERYIPDTTPPGPVTGFTATAGVGQVDLGWNNPSDADFTGTMIRYKTNTYPSGPTDGTLVIDNAAAPGSHDNYLHSGLGNNTYYYAAFAHDGMPNYASSAIASATPGCVAVWLNEIFDNYANGTLGVQGAWTTVAGMTSGQVESTHAVSGKAAMWQGGNGNQIAFEAKSGGSHYVTLDVSQDAGGSLGQLIGYVSYQASDGSEIARLHIQKARMLFEYGSGSFINLITGATNDWYKIKVMFNIDARTLQVWLGETSKGSGLAFKGTGTNLAKIVIVSDTNPNLDPQKMYIDNLLGEAKPTTVAEVRDDGAWTPSLSKLHFAFDPAPCAGEYQYCVGTNSGGSNVKGWTSCGQATDVTATGLPLANNSTYYISVQVGTGNDTWGTSVTSNGIKVAPGVTILGAKGLPNGVSADTKSIRDGVVSATFPGYFYIQDASRQGLKIASNATVSPGDQVDVCGAMQGSGAERYLDATGNPVSTTTPAPGVPGAVAIGATALGGMELNSYTPGVLGGTGPNNIGLYVTVFGKVTATGSGFFYLDDGSGVIDPRIDPLAGVKIISPATANLDEYWAVTGVSTLESYGGHLIRVVRAASTHRL